MPLAVNGKKTVFTKLFRIRIKIRLKLKILLLGIFLKSTIIINY